MDLKPNITFCGSYDAVKPLQDRLQQWLPKDTVEWQRSYGRGTRQVLIDANFIVFQPKLAVFEPRGDIAVGLHQIPVAHLFWVSETDMQTFAKNGTRDKLVQWLQVLNTKQCPNYLIIVIEEVRKAGKALTIFDKVKSEFSSKQGIKCCSVRYTPGSTSSADTQSFSAMVMRLRQVTVQALAKMMLRAEDFVRERRELCRSAHWHYSDHFLLQEQLAFLLETWGCLNESLVQYDELDAMLSQFINNSSAGEHPTWLEDICMAAEEFEGIPLGSPISTALKYRQLLKDRCATLLDIRNHIFTRQSSLLCQMGRSAEVAKRALPFLHATLHEIESLQIKNVPGVTESWVYLSCFQVVRLIDTVVKKNDSKKSSTDDPDSRTTLLLSKAHLVHYAQQKLYQLGALAGLTKDEVPEEEKVDIPQLIAGCIAQQSEHSISPTHLCQAICSDEGFKKHYVELSDETRALFSQQNRHRQAAVVCVELADYYVQFEDFTLAEPLLLEACSGCGSSFLPSILVRNLLLLARCWMALGKMQKYLVACCILASSTSPLPAEEHEKYLDSLEAGDPDADELRILPGKPLVVISGLSTSTPEVRPRQAIQIALHVVSTATRDLLCKCVSLRLRSTRRARRFTAHSLDSVSKHNPSMRRSLFSRSSVIFDEMEDVMENDRLTAHLEQSGCTSVPSRPPQAAGGSEELEYLFSCGSDSFKKPSGSTSSRDVVLTTKDVTLHPGVNVIDLVTESSIVGHLVTASAYMDIGNVRLSYILSPSSTHPSGNSMANFAGFTFGSDPRQQGPGPAALKDSFAVSVVPAEPSYCIQFELASGESRNFFAGTTESVLLGVQTTDDVIEHFVSLVLQPVWGLGIHISKEIVASLTTEGSSTVDNIAVSFYSSENGSVIISMPSLLPHSRLDIPMSLIIDSKIMDEPEPESPVNGGNSSPRKKPSPAVVTRTLNAVLDDAAVEHTETIAFSVCVPMQVTHVPHVTSVGALVAVSVSTNSDCPLDVEIRARWRDPEQALSTFHHKQTVVKTRLNARDVVSSLWLLPDDSGIAVTADIHEKLDVTVDYTTVADQPPQSSVTNQFLYSI